MGKSRNHHKNDDETYDNVLINKKKWYEDEPVVFHRQNKYKEKLSDVNLPLDDKMPLNYYD